MGINETIHDFVMRLRLMPGTNEKIAMIRDAPDVVHKFLHYVYSPTKTYGVRSEKVVPCDHPEAEFTSGLFQLLDKLASREITGNRAVTECELFVGTVPLGIVLCWALDKDIASGVGVKGINKALGKGHRWSILEFNVALAQKYDGMLPPGHWTASRKLDGVRCLIVKEGDKVTAYTRTGQEITTVDHIKKRIAGIGGWSGVLDGELVAMQDGKESFKKTVSAVRKKDSTTRVWLAVFDCLSLPEFWKGSGTRSFSERQLKLDFIVDAAGRYLFKVGQRGVSDDAGVDRALALAVRRGWEGIMLRNDVPYEGKRTKNLLKVKQMHDAEYVVKAVTFGMMGTGKQEEMMAAAVISHKGKKVKVGSGWTEAERRQYHECPKDLIGKTITVKYFEETSDGSLRFPVVKFVHDAKRTL